MKRTLLLLAMLLASCANTPPVRADIYCSLWATPDGSKGFYGRCWVSL